MGFLDSLKGQLRPQAVEQSTARPESERRVSDTAIKQEGQQTSEENVGVDVTDPDDNIDVSGVAHIEAIQVVWGKHGKYFLWAGLAMMMLMFELDNSTVFNYQQYAASSFNKLSLIATINTAATIISAVMKPPVAKISDVIGRGETYIFTISCYVVSYILCARASSFNMYAAGKVFYAMGQSGTQILDEIIISDISNMRWRGFAYSCSYIPFLITPWISAFIVQSVIDGIGWRWGIGMFAILMPFSASFIIVTLLYFQRRARNLGYAVVTKTNIHRFCSVIDLGGLILLCGGFAMLLLPLTLAATTPSRWRTPYIDVLIALGGVALIVLVPYERYVATHPILPVRYFQNASIVCACSLAFVDAIGFSSTHTYMYSWATIAKNYNARDATFLIYTNGVVQCLVGIGAGAIMYRTRRYKWLMISGIAVRLIGYGIMIRLRGAKNSTAELFIVQCVQGWGSGIVATLAVVAAQIQVPHAELAQISSLVLLSTFLGSSVGSAIAGGIYTGTFKAALRHHMGPEVAQDVIDTVFNSITGDIPAWGTRDRVAAALAYSDVMRYITIMALGTSVIMIPIGWILPNHRLGDAHNLTQT
ncbi:ENB1 protein [Phlyctema vagabunda]|uniref:ENB1 protein n=1 Tax=Phlyctema vagabunda TaxID=108571 RepID=A0ABR4PH63_9HELO